MQKLNGQTQNITTFLFYTKRDIITKRHLSPPYCIKQKTPKTEVLRGNNELLEGKQDFVACVGLRSLLDPHSCSNDARPSSW